jgi:hypothetical protein
MFFDIPVGLLFSTPWALLGCVLDTCFVTLHDSKEMYAIM